MDTAPILRSKRLFIEDLAKRLEAMERSETRINPVAYRLYARRLREATAGYPEALLRAQLGAAHRRGAARGRSCAAAGGFGADRPAMSDAWRAGATCRQFCTSLRPNVQSITGIPLV